MWNGMSPSSQPTDLTMDITEHQPQATQDGDQKPIFQQQHIQTLTESAPNSLQADNQASANQQAGPIPLDELNYSMEKPMAVFETPNEDGHKVEDQAIGRKPKTKSDPEDPLDTAVVTLTGTPNLADEQGATTGTPSNYSAASECAPSTNAVAAANSATAAAAGSSYGTTRTGYAPAPVPYGYPRYPVTGCGIVASTSCGDASTGFYSAFRYPPSANSPYRGGATGNYPNFYVPYGFGFVPAPSYGFTAAPCYGTYTNQAQTGDLPQAGPDVQEEVDDNGKNESWKIGHFRVGEVIGQGNYARVRKGFHQYTKIKVAVKCIDKQKMDPATAIRTQREIEVLKRLNHFNIANLYQIFETSRGYYIVMQLAANGELADFLERLPHGRRLSEEDARLKFWQIVAALEYCHTQGVVHRDLKLENILLDKSYNIKIVDFGFANFYKQDDTLKTYCGSPPYAAPEIFEGHQYVGPEVDIWSMGVILYKMVSGDFPFTAPTYHELRQKITRGTFRIPYYLTRSLEDLLLKMLHKNPKKRATMMDIKCHPWMQNVCDLNRFLRVFRPNPDFTIPVDRLLNFMQKTMKLECEQVIKSCMNNARDDYQVWYQMIWELVYMKDIVKENYRPEDDEEGETEVGYGNPNYRAPFVAVYDRNGRAIFNRPLKPLQRPKAPAVTAEAAEATATETAIATATATATTTATTAATAAATALVAAPPQSPAPIEATEVDATEPVKEQPEATAQETVEDSKNEETKEGKEDEECPMPSEEQLPKAHPEGHVLKRQSTSATITSLDEGFETDVHNSSTTLYNSKEQPSKFEFRATSLPHETAETTEVDAKQGPCQPRNHEFDMSSGTGIQQTAEAQMGNVAGAFGEEQAAKDDMLLGQAAAMDTASGGNGEVYQPTSGNVQERLQCIAIAQAINKKRISLPENLEFQPQKLLSIKQSLHVAQKLDEDPETVDEAKQAQRARIIKQLQLKNRLHYVQKQTSQKHGGTFTQTLPPIYQEDQAGTSQSPIEEEPEEEPEEDIAMEE